MAQETRQRLLGSFLVVVGSGSGNGVMLSGKLERTTVELQEL